MQGFVNKHLEKVGVSVTDLSAQFHDGVFFIILTGTLGGFFVPLNKYAITPETSDDKV
jgi:hypothetical protein